jgi:hypothetical protein|tara:strand:- start:31 stop:417 length:387 start_codon:yes stop_codon:yes gene_type:complete
MKIEIPISCGELVDKLTILEIKGQHITESEKLNEVKKEFKELSVTFKTLLKSNPLLQKYYDQLLNINTELWLIEDEIRVCEKNNDFGDNFIKLARSVYKTNDKRFHLKNDVNKLFNSNIKEQKSYKEY